MTFFESLSDNHGTRACAVMNKAGTWESKSCSDFGGYICKLEAQFDPDVHTDETCDPGESKKCFKI